MTEQEMVRAIITEMRAAELATTLRHAVAGDAHWRLEAKQLLDDIDNGILRKRAAEILNDVCCDD